MSYTPGPWPIDSDKHRQPVGFYGGEEGYHAIDVGDCRITGFMGDDNARLIAAAPELLEALKLLLADLNGYEAWERPCHAVDVAKSAIAKASPATECSICRREHGREIQHESE